MDNSFKYWRQQMQFLSVPGNDYVLLIGRAFAFEF